MPHSTHKKTADMDAVEDGQVPFQALEGCICWARDAPLVIALPLLCMRPCCRIHRTPSHSHDHRS
jgi:hypothetical protein